MSMSTEFGLLSALNAAGQERVHAQLASTLLQCSGDLLTVKDLNTGSTVHLNDAMAAFLGKPVAAALKSADIDLFGGTLAATFRAAEQTAVANAEPLRVEHRFEWKGQRRDFSVLRFVVRDTATDQRWLVGVWHDMAPEFKRQAQLQVALDQIEQQQLANDALRREITDQALRDQASGLYRRAHFEDQLRREVDLSTREHREFAIVFIHIDPDTPVVQQQGSAGFNRVLEAMGRLLRGGTRAMDASCRYDERRFAVLLSGVGLATAHARMEGLRRKCEAQIVVHEGQEMSFTVSLGVASFPHTESTQDGLVAACQKALAEAQRRGGNHVTLAAIQFKAP
jgi:diguanylate cyclase (GGDEF)-like protein